MADALFSASFLNACLRHAEDVGMANVAPIVNTRGPIYVHADGIVRRTTFHTLAMYANRLEGRVGRLDLEAGMLRDGNRSIAVVDAVATVDDSGKRWAIALVNRHPSKAVACTVAMKETLLEGSFGATVLQGDSPEAFNDVERPNRVVPEETRVQFERGVVQLPAHSLVIVEVARE
jgi:alpha-L-arabinofuranosidase